VGAQAKNLLERAVRSKAFLAFNEMFDVVFASNFLHQRHPEVLERYFSAYESYDEVGPGSFWIKRAT
jgi:hypothetical protein